MRQRVAIGTASFEVVRDLGGGAYHDSTLLDQDGVLIVMRLYKAAYAGELERQWMRWRECGLGQGGSTLVGYMEAGTHDGRPYLLRRWVDGEPFDAFAKRMKVSSRQPEDALEVGQSICRAIASLHDAGLVHGHISNSNLLFDGEGAAIVVDPLVGAPTALTLHLGTQKPGLRGNLSPEQHKAGGKIDARTDVWQLGLLLARLYTRKPDLVVNQRILMELYNAKLPLGLIKVIWQAIQEDPANRFSEANTLATALAEITLAENQRTVYVRPAPPPAQGVRDGVNPALRNTAIFLVTVGLVAGGAWLFREYTSKPAPSQTTTPALAPTPAVIPSSAPLDARLLRPRFIFETNLGRFEIEAYGDAAPIAVLNFARHVEAGSFDGVAFDRVVPNFVIQAGQFTMTGDRKQSLLPPVRNEWLNGGEAIAGTIGMSRMGNDPDTITTTFFINLTDNRRVFGTRKDGTGEIIFGKVVGGAEVVRAISQSKTVNKFGGAWPEPPVYITSAYIDQGFEPALVVRALETKQPQTVTLANGVSVEDVVVGRGRQFDPRKAVIVHCVGRVQGGAVFDSTRERGTPMTLQPESYARGLGDGLAGMLVGGRRIITIPAGLGYGSTQMANIPLNSSLAFDVQLIAQTEAGRDDAMATAPPSPTPRTTASAAAPLGSTQIPMSWTLDVPGAEPITLVGILPFEAVLGHATEPNNPPHTVTVTKPFSIAAQTVTVEQFGAFVRATNYTTTAESAGGDQQKQVWSYQGSRIAAQPGLSWRNPGFAQESIHPVTSISWIDANAFCVWLSGRTGRPVRLPTEAEWEYAARGGASTKYWWGDDAAGANGVANVGDQAIAQQFPSSQQRADWNDGFATTAPATSFKANTLGLYGIGGNVWEWCNDRWQDRLPNGRLVDPTGPDQGDVRTFKGSSFIEFPPNGLSYRYGNKEAIAANNRGFRIVVADEWRSLDTVEELRDATTITRDQIGNFVAVRGQIARYAPSTDARTPHILTIVDRAAEPVEVIYWPDVASRIVTRGQPQVGASIAVAGTVADYRGKLQIRITRPEQIRYE